MYITQRRYDDKSVSDADRVSDGDTELDDQPTDRALHCLLSGPNLQGAQRGVVRAQRCAGAGSSGAFKVQRCVWCGLRQQHGTSLICKMTVRVLT